MSAETYGVTTFKSTHYTIQAESIFKENGIVFKTIPTPREITVSCGLAIIFSLDDFEKVKEIAQGKSVNIDGVYKYIKDGVNSKAERLI